MIELETAQASIFRAKEIVECFLSAVEDRDLKVATSLLDKDFQMQFPGGKNFSRLDELVAWAKTRYKWVRKNCDRFDTCLSGDETIVYCYGTLHGEWADGTTFTNIRFIDRFVVKYEKLIQQEVWNDLAEVMRN